MYKNQKFNKHLIQLKFKIQENQSQQKKKIQNQKKKMSLKELTIFLMAFCCVLAGDQHVLELSDDDFSTKVAETETTLVMFYAPW